MDEARLALIRFVALRYRQLQGLRAVSDGIFLLLMPIVFRWDGHGGLKPGGVVGSTVLFVAASLLVQQLIGALYDRRFGRAGARLERRDWHEPVAFAFFVAYAIGVIAAQITDNPWLRSLLVLAALGAGPARIVWRDWPYRTQWLLPGLVAVAGAVMFSGVRSLQDIAGWTVLVWRTGGLAVIAAGLVDHALLAKSMIRSAQEKPEAIEP